jgi:hypothetical protein
MIPVSPRRLYKAASSPGFIRLDPLPNSNGQAETGITSDLRELDDTVWVLRGTDGPLHQGRVVNVLRA